MEKEKDTFTIRRAEEKDTPAIASLLLQVAAIHHEGRPDLFKAGTRKYTDSELAEILKDDARPVFVAELPSGEIAGYAFCVFQQHKGDNILTGIKTLYIDDLCVDEKKRGKGAGKALYRFALDFARRQGCYNVTLNVWSCNTKALAFYKAMGLSVQKQGMEQIL